MLSRICGLLATHAIVYPTPTVTATSGSSPVCGGGTVTVYGTGFYDVTGVKINGVSCTGVVRVSHTAIECVAPLGAAYGVAYDVEVTTTHGVGTGTGVFSYVQSPFTLTGISPDGGEETTAFSLFGTGFLDATQVYANAFPLTWSIVDDTRIDATHQAEGPVIPYVGDIEVTDGATTLNIPFYVGLRCDQYSFANQSGTSNVGGSSVRGVYQSFLGDGRHLWIARFRCFRSAALTGNVTAKLYAQDAGTFGGTGKPTGAALASCALVANTAMPSLGFTSQVTEFVFAPGQRPLLAAGTPYFIGLEFTTGGGTINVATDATSPTHPGSMAVVNSVGAYSLASSDVIFDVITLP